MKRPVSTYLYSSADPVKALFKVSQVWKGDVTEEVAVYTALSSESCGYEGFAEGKEYIVFAYDEIDHLVTGICEGTKLPSAQEELAVLGEGIAPAESDLNIAVTDKASSHFTITIIIIGVVIIGAVILFGRKFE